MWHLNRIIKTYINGKVEKYNLDKESKQQGREKAKDFKEHSTFREQIKHRCLGGELE